VATLREIKGRIAGVKSTEKITKAMKMVAAAKLRRAESALFAARPYSWKLSEMMRHLAANSDLSENKLVAQREIKSVCIISVTADRGFCGAFNSNIIKATATQVREGYRDGGFSGTPKLIPIGKKGYDFFMKRKFEVMRGYPGIFHDLTIATAKRIVADIVRDYMDGSIDRVDIVYNEFKSIIHQRLVTEQFLPIPKETVSPSEKKFELEYIYEPGMDAILDTLLPRHLEYQMWRILLESNAAGEGARMAAMDNASENAGELISSLSLQYNKARQASITKELLEVVSGAEALRALS